ncbi:TPA: fibronectin/fibrinogen-binding protein [bacterium]|nr:fibronectin/fibrinogen-binding protein [bacterium]
MPFDSLILRSVVSQLNDTVIGGKVLGVIQNSPYDFIIRIGTERKKYNLLFSIHPSYARTHLIKNYPDQDKRWHFADFLQTHLKNGTISSVDQKDFDRIIVIKILSQQDVMDSTTKILIGEFMGKHSNVILIDEGTNKILESMKHIDESKSSFRQVLPGETYYPPPITQTIDFFSINKDNISEILKSGEGQVWKKLVKNIQGMSPTLAKDVVARSDKNSSDSIFDSIMQIRNDIAISKYTPNVLILQNELIDVSAIELIQYDTAYKKTSFDNISEALETFFDHEIAKDSFIADKNSLIQSVKKRHYDLLKKHDILEDQLKIAENAEELKKKGDIIITNLNSLQRGQKEAILQDPYSPDGNEIRIELDEKLSPSNNAQKYYQEYKKAKKSKEIVEKLYEKNKKEIDQLLNISKIIEHAEDTSTLDDIRQELIKKGITKAKTSETRKIKQEVTLFKRFRSSDDFLIYVGRNSAENDLIVKQESSPNDMWLHAQQIEGSHVLILNPEKKPDIPRRTLIEAAILAANFSKAKHSSVVPIDYTWAKYVRKPKGAKPGFVIYTNEKTLFVSPSGKN